jgi:hypothetical protein
MAKRYATGKNALAECQRCSKRIRYQDIVEDGYLKGLLVCSSCYDAPHPQDTPVDASEGIALYRPAPEISLPDDEGEAAPALTFEPYD